MTSNSQHDDPIGHVCILGFKNPTLGQKLISEINRDHCTPTLQKKYIQSEYSKSVAVEVDQ